MPVAPDAEIVQRFAYHPATKESAALHDHVRNSCMELALAFNHGLPPSVEAVRALAALQEAMMWANAAIAIHLAPVATEEQKATPQPHHGQVEVCGKASATSRGQAFTCILPKGHEGDLHMAPPTTVRADKG